MSKLVLLIVTFSLISLSGCATKVTNYQQTIDGNAMDFSKIDSMKKGKACSSFTGNSDSSLSAAAENGGITVVKHVELEYIIGLVPGQHCTIAYGE